MILPLALFCARSCLSVAIFSSFPHFSIAILFSFFTVSRPDFSNLSVRFLRHHSKIFIREFQNHIYDLIRSNRRSRSRTFQIFRFRFRSRTSFRIRFRPCYRIRPIRDRYLPRANERLTRWQLRALRFLAMETFAFLYLSLSDQKNLLYQEFLAPSFLFAWAISSFRDHQR